MFIVIASTNQLFACRSVRFPLIPDMPPSCPAFKWFPASRCIVSILSGFTPSRINVLSLPPLEKERVRPTDSALC